MAPDPGPDLLTLLHELAHAMRTRFDQRARQHGMTRAQWVILYKLRRQAGLTQKELAQLVEVEPMTVARLVDRLESAGYVERRADPGDRRVWRLHLLPSAAALMSEIDKAREEIYAAVVGQLPAEEVAHVTRALARMKSNLLSNDTSAAAPAAREDA